MTAEWQPIETVPPPDRTVPIYRRNLLLGSFPKGFIAVDNPYRLTAEYWTTIDGVFHKPTHWMPLPEPPK